MIPLVLHHLCLACFKCTVNIMPDFLPNDYLYETHMNKGEERWEIFAWAVRDAMINAGNFKQSDISLRRKINYEKFM